jgi:arylsulfatase A-like enzyme
MLTLKSWKDFWLNHFFGIMIFFIPLIILSCIFSSGFVYLGENTSSLFATIVRTQPLLVFTCLVKILGTVILAFIGLHFFSLGFQKRFKILFGFIFFSCVILRIESLYPGIADKWFIVSHIDAVHHFVENISLLPLDSKLRKLINWSPFLCCSIFFFFNFIFYMKNLIRQGRLVQKSRSSIYIDELDVTSKIFSIQGLSFLLSLVFGAISLTFLNSSFRINLPLNNTNQTKPNVFIFASDSLRYDRLANDEYKYVMPFLKSKLKEATLFKPMLVGIPRTFPSWVEISMGEYSMKTGVRNMFPSKSSRQDVKQTMFQLAKEDGYSTLFVSDFAGDIFPRYPFGGTIIDAPSSNLKTLVENGMLSILSPFQALLTLPSLQRVLPSLLESPEIADPRLVANAFANDLSQVSNLPQPVFATTFFSSAHFPYASPGPWYGKFQKAPIAFQKIPDQAMSKNASYKLNHPSEEKKDQPIALYNGGLNAIDFTLEKLLAQLKEKGWLENSLIFIFGDHGENLYDGDMGMGHGDGVAGEYSTVTPLVIFDTGDMKKNIQFHNHDSFARTVDIAPTISKKLDFQYSYENSDGRPLLNEMTSPSQFPLHTAYMETGIWFTSGKFTPENQPRTIYPGVVALLDVDPSLNFEFYIRPTYIQAVAGLKERAWVDSKYRLVVRTLKTGTQLFLYSRKDTTASQNLANTKIGRPIALKMLHELNTYLISQGVEIVPTQNGSFFYAENIVQ